jgi:putative ABC transport system permease protein
MFRPSSGEAIIGRGVVGRYEGTELGKQLSFGRSLWKVVGVFESNGSSYESEVWVDVRELANDAKHPMPYSGLRIRARSEPDLLRLKQRIDDDPRFALEGERETDYYAKQSESANSLYLLVIGIAALAGVGAGFGAANTMYAAVVARTAEIGTLRALGFSRSAVVIAFELEAVALAFCGFLLGTVLAVGLAMLLREILGGVGFGAATFTTNVITLRVGRFDVTASFVLALVIGVASGIGPAWRAARMRPIEALRRG